MSTNLQPSIVKMKGRKQAATASKASPSKRSSKANPPTPKSRGTAQPIDRLSTNSHALGKDELEYAREELATLRAKIEVLPMTVDMKRFLAVFPIADGQAWEDELFESVNWVDNNALKRELVACAIYILTNIADGIGNHVRSAYFQLVTIIFEHLLTPAWQKIGRERFINAIGELKSTNEHVRLFLDSCHFFRVTGNDRSHDYPPRKLSVPEAEIFYNTFNAVFTNLKGIVAGINALKGLRGRGRSGSLTSNASTASSDSSASSSTVATQSWDPKALMLLIPAKREYCGDENVCSNEDCLKSHSASEIRLYNPDFKKTDCKYPHNRRNMSAADVRKAHKECPFNHGDRQLLKDGGFYHTERTRRFLLKHL